MSGLRFTRTQAPERAAAVYEHILAPAFTFDELVDEKTFTDMAGDPDCTIHEAVIDGELVGTAVTETSDGVTLLSWLAVSPEVRSHGVGAALLSKVRQDAAGAKLLLAEVEDPAFYSAHPLRGDPARRLAFYSRFGAETLPLPYFQPPVREGGARVHNLLLLSIPIPGRTRSGASSALLHHYLAEYIPEISDADPDRDALLDAALAS